MNISNIKWNDITKEQLKYLYVDKGLTEADIAGMFNIKKGKVNYKRKKFSLIEKDKKPFNAKLGKVGEEDIIKFIKDYYDKNGVTPKLSQFVEKKGFPCNKEYLAKYYRYNELVKKAGLKTYEYGRRHYNENKMLADVRRAVLTSKSTDIKFLSKKFSYIKHRDTYTRLFGGFHETLILAGIYNKHIILLQRYSDYKLQEPVEFIKEKFGKNGEYTDKQNELIKQIDIGVGKTHGDLRRVSLQKFISLRACIVLFSSFTIALIAAGYNPCKTLGSRYCADDGHMCDSYAEALVDNILCKMGVRHSIHENYPGSRLKSDFKIEDSIKYIEYTGYKAVKNIELKGKYNKRLEEKRILGKKLGIEILEINEVNDSTIDIVTEFVERNEIV